MKPGIRTFIATCMVFLLVALGAGSTFAAEAGRKLVPPRGASSQAYLDLTGGKGLQTEITYRAADNDQSGPEPSKSLDGGWFDLGETTGWVLLALLALTMAVILYRSRNALGEMTGPKARGPLPSGEELVKQALAPIDHDLIERLRAEPDPGEGLRLVLQRFLVLAAQENSVALKRSLTTREIMQRLPGEFSHRSALETLASEVERVVFGGKSIEPEQYQHCLDLAAPFLRRAKP